MVLEKKRGVVTGSGKYLIGDTATLTSTPEKGYKFVQWDDGNSDNPRNITITNDTTHFIALYSKETYTVKATPKNKKQGNVEGSGDYEFLSTATLTATPKEGFEFQDWSDGVTDYVRTITVTDNMSLTANFTPVEIPVEIVKED